MKPYHKIQTVFKRNPETKYRTLLVGDYSLPEFAYLAHNIWVWTEKIDGTNIRVKWDGQQVRFGGKSDGSQVPTFLLDRLQDLFLPETLSEALGCQGLFCLYGEGYGAKIQGGGKYIPHGVDFILFDVLFDDSVWLERESVEDIALKLSVGVVPIIAKGTLPEAVDAARVGFTSKVAAGEILAEGLVMRPEVELLNRRGGRVIAKIKHKDFG